MDRELKTMKSIGNIIHLKTFPLSLFDNDDNEIYFETSGRYWIKRAFDANGKVNYFENSMGYKNDSRS